MIWNFKPANAKAFDLKSAKPGDFLLALRANGGLEKWLKLAGGDSARPTFVNLTGKHALEVWEVQVQSALPTLLFAEGAKLELEIDDTSSVGDTTGSNVGTLLIADREAYFVASTQSLRFSTECCISLESWEVVDYYSVENVRASFSKWRLVDRSQPEEKRIVLAFGDWASTV